MTTGNTTNGTINKARKLGRFAGLIVLGMGLLAGGCNKAIKEENAALLRENAQLRQQLDQQAAASSAMQQGSAGYYDQGMSGGGGGSTPRSERVIEIAGDVLFDAGKATLKSTAKKDLDRVVSTIRGSHSGRTIRVVGHTDSDPIKKSNWPSNEALSEARAQAVADYISSKGISRSSITVIGKGASEPKSSKSASRRVEVVIVETY